MSDEAWFGVAVVGLLAALALGYRRWRGVAGANGLTTFVLVSTALGGLIGAPFWWFDLPASFAWDLPPVGSRMLAAAALAFGVAGIVVLEYPTVARIRFYFILIALYLIPLALAAIALHLDRFDFTKPVTYGFFAVVVVLSLGALASIFGGDEHVLASGAPVPVWAWLLIAGIVLSAWGCVLFAVPTAPVPLVFNWPTDPLTSRLIASMLVTLGVAFLLSRRSVNLARLSLIFGSVYGLGVLAACLMNIAAGKPAPPLYTGALGFVGAVSLALWALSPRNEPETVSRVAG